MAACYLEAVRSFQPVGPYFLGGYCFGGNVACEMARQLVAQGQRVALLVLLDSAPANIGYEVPGWWRPSYLRRFVRNLGFWLADFAALPGQDRRVFVARKLRAFGRHLKRRLRGESGASPVDLEGFIDLSHFSEAELKLWRIHLEAASEYIQPSYPGAITLLRTRGQPLLCSLDEDFCWGQVARGGVVIKRIPGSHESIFTEPNVQCLAQQLEACLARARSEASAPHL
jgi:thioesterase domain-containing protein